MSGEILVDLLAIRGQQIQCQERNELSKELPATRLQLTPPLGLGGRLADLQPLEILCQSRLLVFFLWFSMHLVLKLLLPTDISRPDLTGVEILPSLGHGRGVCIQQPDGAGGKHPRALRAQLTAGGALNAAGGKKAFRSSI